MRRYEVNYILAPGLSPEEVEQSVETYKGVAEEKGAKVLDVDNWGKKKLAFEVKKHSEGYYVVLTVEEPSGEAVAELERRFKVADPVIRFLTVRIDEDLQRAEKFKAKREAKKARKKARQAQQRAEEAEAEKEQAAAEKEEEKAEAEKEKEKAKAKAKAEKEKPEAKKEAEEESAEASGEAGRKEEAQAPEEDEEKKDKKEKKKKKKAKAASGEEE